MSSQIARLNFPSDGSSYYFVGYGIWALALCSYRLSRQWKEAEQMGLDEVRPS